MKKLVLWGILAALLCALPARGETQSAICLQVVGETDLSEDQRYKLLVRAWAEELLSPLTADAPEDDALWQSLEAVLPRLQAYLNHRAEDAGRPANIRVCAGRFPYAAHALEDRTYPAGDYRAIRITIGGGQGHNWWGVLYQPPEPDTIYYSILVEWFLHLFQ